MSFKSQENFSEPQPTLFIRGSKMRKSFRIRHRYNAKFPPAAIIFMKNLEQNDFAKFDTLKTKSIVRKPEIEETDEKDLNETFDPLVDEEEVLIAKSPVLTRRGSLKKLKSKRKLKMNNFINFFKK